MKRSKAVKEIFYKLEEVQKDGKTNQNHHGRSMEGV